MSDSLKSVPVLPLRDIVVFPNMICPLFVGRKKSVKALEKAVGADSGLILTAQKDPNTDDPGADDLFTTAVHANILQLLKIPDGTVKVLVEGKTRMTVERYFVEDECLNADAVPFHDVIEDDQAYELEMKVIVNRLRQEFQNFARRQKSGNEDTLKEISEFNDPAALADAVVSHLNVDVPRKQEILDFADIKARAEAVLRLLHDENRAAQVEKKVKRRVRSQMTKTQREYYLNEQMKAIQRELGENEEKSEIEELEARIDKTKLSDEAREKAQSELKRLRTMGSNASEANIVRNYLEWILSIPWGVKREIQSNLTAAEEILNADHYGLEKVKERLVEYIAVQQRTKKISGPILCLVGPPGVGKTSLGESAARATGRDFLRISLGGVGDEAEIRGHRRTYIGSMPGRIIQSMKKAQSVNPLILLDEVDKLGSSVRGDPSSALLEVLDPEQNSRFVDHYLEIDYDLSDVLFVTTANYIGNIPEPLRDRMEVIPLAGYTEDEKTEIARRHLIPKQRKAHGIKASEFRVKDTALTEMLRVYTREAGVRNLEREIAKLARKTVTQLVKGEIKSLTVTPRSLEKFLGLPKYRYGLAEEEDRVGVVTGLAYTAAGGDLLSIEAIAMTGKGRIKSTGKLGTVMKESIEAASSYVQSISPEIGVRSTDFGKLDIHVHVPEGAVPKDGPSAGVAMVTAIVSVLTGLKVRRDIAMTGEVTLRGNVLPVGGLKAKLLAAARGGIKTVLLPEKNMKDLSEISGNVKEALQILPISDVREVLDLALEGEFSPIREEVEISDPEQQRREMQETVSVSQH